MVAATNETTPQIHARMIAGFEGYTATTDGRVYSQQSGRFLSQLRTPSGYLHVVLCRPGFKRRVAVHVVVLEAFAGECPKGMVCNHLNGIKTDNRVENLEWVTQAENVKHAYDTGLRTINERHRERCAELGRAKRSFTAEDVDVVRASYTGKRGEMTSIAKKLGLSRYAIASILKLEKTT